MQSSRSLALVGSMVRRLFDRFKESVLSVQEYVLLSARGLAAIFTPPHYPREIVAQMDSLGVGSLSIVVLTGMFIRKLVAPRLLAGIVMVPILTIISDTLGIFGGSLIGIFNLKLSWEFFWRSVGNALTINDLVMGLGKPVMFGFILTSVGCHMGLRTTGGTQGVGLSTTRSVVVASVTILASDFFMTKILLMLFPVN
jgi:ABC-type transporter Mla maintaining outer membrane lipid asymmetry permease subunit MlaE